jgi:protein-L-isoaspartate(D-aspartate) O-methyltransferase
MNEINSMISTLKRKGIQDKKILDAMSSVNRSLFVLESSKNLAYSDLSLPIGEAQMILKPYETAKMLELLEIKAQDKILVIGSGTGYTLAILSKLCQKSIGLEINKALYQKSKELVKESNTRILHMDGSNGFMQGYPYDKILISVGIPKIRQDLIDQLNPDGIIVAPIGDRMNQVITQIKKTRNGFEKKEFDKVMLLPISGEKGF